MNSKPLLDIGDKEWHIVKAILQQHVPDREVWAFGSRAKWTAKEFSDLDLAILGDKSLTLDESAALTDAFADSDLPWKVDVVDWVTTSPSFRKIIKRDKVLVQSPSKFQALDLSMSSEWSLQRLDQIAEINPSRKVRKGNVVPFVDMAALPQLSRDISKDGISAREAKGAGAHFQNGDTLLARITPCLENGKTAQVRCLDNNAIAEGSTEFIVLCGKDPADNDFIYYLCREPTFREYAIGRMEGTSGRQRVSWQSIAAYEFPFPSPNERRAAARVLSALDDRIALLRETNTTLEAIAQALFKSWFVDFDPVHAKMQGRIPEGMDETTAALFPDSFEESELGPVPKMWTVGRLDDLLVLQRGFDLPAQDRTPGDFPIIAASGPSGTHHKAMVKGPGVVTGRSGVLGRVFFELEDFWPLNTTLWVKEFKAATPCYAYEVLRLLDFKSFNAGSAVPSLNRNHIHGLPYLLPERGCVDAFEGIALQIYKRCRVNEKQARSLEDVRDALLPRLISGQHSLENKG